MSDVETESRLRDSFVPVEWIKFALAPDDALEALTVLEVVARLLSRAHRRLADEAPSTAKELVQASVDEINRAYSELIRSQDLSDHVVSRAAQRVDSIMRVVNERVDREGR
jgi:hypothetical protein